MRMHSGARRTTRCASPTASRAMVFVPCVEGISTHPAEDADPADAPSRRDHPGGDPRADLVAPRPRLGSRDAGVSRSSRPVEAVRLRRGAEERRSLRRGGELVGLLGPNGAGNPTLVKIRRRTRAAKPRRGERRRRAGRVAGRAVPRSATWPSSSAFPGWYTADEVLELHQRLAGSHGGAAERARLLELVALTDARDRRVAGMSKGMAQRLGSRRPWSASRGCCCSTSRPPRSIRSAAAWCDHCSRSSRGAGYRPAQLAPASEVELVCDRVAILLGGELVAAGRRRALAPRGVELDTDEGVRLVERATREDTPRLVAEAVAAGRRVYGVRVLASTLEDVYLEAVGGETD